MEVLTVGQLKTQGTELYLLDPDDTGNEVRKIAQLTGLPGVGGGGATEIDVTNMDSTSMEFQVGINDNGTISIGLDFDPQDAGHTTLLGLIGGANKRFFIGCSEAATDPTFSSGYTLPTDRTTVDFIAGVQSVPLDLNKNDVVRATLTIRVSGALTITPAS